MFSAIGFILCIFALGACVGFTASAYKTDKERSNKIASENNIQRLNRLYYHNHNGKGQDR